MKICQLSFHNYLFIFLFMLSGFSFKGQGTTKYGLQIINKAEQYKKIIQNAPQKKLVRITKYLKPFATNIFYNTENNFTKEVLYIDHELYLNLKTTQKLAQVQDSLLKRGFNLLIFDAYRPYAVTEKMWKIVPDERYAANPAKGSGHNRGIAIDCSLIDNNSGNPIEMPTAYDNFSDSAHHDFRELPAEKIKNRQLLRCIFEHFGFVALNTEWWHYSLPEVNNYPIFDFDFNQLSSL